MEELDVQSIYYEGREDSSELDEEDAYDEEHGALLGFMKGHELDQNGLIDELIDDFAS